MKQIAYVAVIEQGDRGFGAYFPDLPGCVTVGDTVDDAIAKAHEALGLHIWGMLQDSEMFPEATAIADVRVDPEVREIARIQIEVNARGPTVIARKHPRSLAD